MKESNSIVYFDNAATSYPKPKPVLDSITDSLHKYGANPGRSGHDFAMTTAAMIFNSREAVNTFVGSKGAENICFTLNTTYAVNFALKGVLKRGDHIIISSFEHNAVFRTVYALSQKGILYDIAQIVPYDTKKTVEQFASKIRPNTKMIACMYASNVFGLIFPIDELAKLAKAHGLLFFVDAAQAAGIIPINMARQNIDYLCFSPHKGLYCPMGVGVLAINNDEVIDTLIEGGTGSSSVSPLMPDFLPDRLEGGTPNTSAIISIIEGIKFLNEKGIKNIHSKEINMLAEIYDYLLSDNRVILYTQRPDLSNHVPVLSFNVKDKDSMEISSLLNEDGICVRAGIHCAPLAHKSMRTIEVGTVRISPSVFSTKNDVDFLIKSLDKILKKL